MNQTRRVKSIKRAIILRASAYTAVYLISWLPGQASRITASFYSVPTGLSNSSLVRHFFACDPRTPCLLRNFVDRINYVVVMLSQVPDTNVLYAITELLNASQGSSTQLSVAMTTFLHSLDTLCGIGVAKAH